ncbi:MAG: hypothetical protein WB952_23510 [Terriglobales bacterium]
MDQFSITDRLESTTPVRNPGPENSSHGDAQPQRRKPAPPKTEASEETHESPDTPELNDDQNSHQIDELA